MRRARQPIRGEGTVLEVLPNGLRQTVMKNGYEVLAHLDHAVRERATGFQPTERVWVEFSAYDMSQGRIIGEAE